MSSEKKRNAINKLIKSKIKNDSPLCVCVKSFVGIFIVLFYMNDPF